jgi:hypothetical protein
VIVDNVRSVGYFKSRPAPHKLEGITTRQHSGVVLAAYPRNYPLTSQQKKVKEAAKACGIHTGISRAALVKAMTECIPTKF